MGFPFEPIITYHDSSDKSVKMVADHRHYPILFVRPYGWGEDGLDFYFVRWRNKIAKHAASEGKSIVVIFDLSESSTPPATMRKRAGDYAKDDKKQPGLLKTIFISPSALLRGIITAVVWMAGSENVPIAFVASLQEAINAANVELEQANIRSPNVDASTYQIPKLDDVP